MRLLLALTNRCFQDSRLYPIVLGIILTFLGVDVMVDLHEGVPLEHLLHEGLLIFFCLAVLGLQSMVLRQKSAALTESRLETAKSLEERAYFQQRIKDLSSQFSSATDEQFARWALSAGERDVAILLIKGMAMKEIAELRHSSEATVRQQAANVYRKSCLEGRNKLAAYFLEGLFAAPHAGPPQR